MKDFDKAISQYKLAMKLAPGKTKREREVRFRSLFNIAAILGSQNKVDEALETYQNALEMKPDSKETKTNMELLTQGGSGGKGDKDSKDKNEEGEGGEDQKDKNFSNKPRENQPQPYKGKDLSRQDVDRILDELKQQEEAIRAKDQREGGKDAPPDKDW
jgi:tetratricopeptide (TPR) repeat protein